MSQSWTPKPLPPSNLGVFSTTPTANRSQLTADPVPEPGVIPAPAPFQMRSLLLPYALTPSATRPREPNRDHQLLLLPGHAAGAHFE